MKFYKVRQYLQEGKNINDINLRVTFYARVSTLEIEQLNSLDNQITYFKDYIKSNSNWTYIDGYIDEGISGSTVAKRKNFLKMINDAKEDKFDLIITKEVSRFSRNLSDSIKYTQILMQNDVGVYFQTNGINTYDPNSEFILNMMGSVAQEEVKRLSERVKWGHKEAIKKGRVLGSNNIIGYTKNNATLVIEPNEANKIREIFKLYATGKYGFTKLALILYNKGIKNSKGNIYDKDTLKRIIENPKYKGYYRGHTTEIIDYKTKKRINISKEEQIIYKSDKIPKIVSEELWNKANKVLEERRTEIKSNSYNSIKKYPYTSKIICGNDGCKYSRMTNKNNKLKPRWACCNYIKYRLNVCKSPIIYECDLDNIFINILKNLFNLNDIIKTLADYYINCKNNIEYDTVISNIENNIKKINLKKEKILDLLINNIITNNEYIEKNNNYNNDISILKKKIDILKEEKSKKSITPQKLINEVKEKLKYKDILEDFINTFLEKVIVYKNNDDRKDLTLEIYMNIGNIKNTVIYKTNYLKEFKTNKYRVIVYTI
jgi:site-specific DNA recombinase